MSKTFEYPPIRITKHALRLELQQGQGRNGWQYVEIHVWIWDPDTGWGWVGAQFTDLKPPMLASYRTKARKILLEKWTALSKLKTQTAIRESIESVSHGFPDKLPDQSYWAEGVT